MLSSDALQQLKQLKNDIHASRNLHRGTVRATGQKFGFVRLDSGKDIYLPATEMERVLPEDYVEVELKKEGGQKTLAVLEKLIKSNTQEFWGRYVVSGKAHFVEPDLPGMSRWIFVPPDKRGKAKADDLVRCVLTQHPFRSGKAQAKVAEVLPQSPDAIWQYMIRKNALRCAWPKAVETQLESLTEAAVLEQAEGRLDLSGVPFVTIDARSTVDLDDAIWAQKLESGWRLQVAIADPSALIASGSAIEQELLSRASSVYLPGQQIPMLPAKLSSDLCSLVEGRRRLAKVLSFELAVDGSVREYDVYSAVISSHRKLSYEEVALFLEQGDATAIQNAEIAKSLQAMQELGLALQAWRRKHCLLGGERQDYFLELDENRRIRSIKAKPHTIAHQIVEEAMVLVNRTVAANLCQQGCDSLYVCHAGVRDDRRESVNRLIGELKLLPESDGGIDTLPGFVALNQLLQQQEELKPWQLVLNRQLERAQLSTQAKPHFGMGLAAYTTITSPLRKAVDFMVHRQLGAATAVALTPQLCEQLEAALARVRTTQNELEQWLKCEYMTRDTAVHWARVHRVFAAGVQVRLEETGIEGTVEVRELNGKFSFNNDHMTLIGEKLSFSLDQRIQVKLKEVNWQRRQVYFSLVQSA